MPSELIGEEWEFILIEDDNVINAFALPSAKVGYRGIQNCKSDADLAVVIGHEMAMLWLNMGERMSQQMVALGGVFCYLKRLKAIREKIVNVYLEYTAWVLL